MNTLTNETPMPPRRKNADESGTGASQLRGILATNLRRMIDAEGRSIRAWAIARGLDVRLIDRLTNGDNAVTLDKLHEVATACHLEPWHLLLPDLDHTAPRPAPVSDEDRALLAKLRRLLND